MAQISNKEFERVSIELKDSNDLQSISKLIEKHGSTRVKILVKDQNNIEHARGLSSFSSFEVEKIKGSHSKEIKNILGYSSREEIIHKDDLVKV